VNHIVDLEPGRIDEYTLMPETATEAIYTTVNRHLRYALGEMLVEPDFRATEVPNRFIELVDEVTPTLIAERLRNEHEWDYDRAKVVARKLGDLSLSAVDPKELQLAPEFIEDMKSQIGNLPYGFSELQRYHELWRGTRIFDLLSTVRNLENSAESNPDWLNQIFTAVESAANEPEAFTPPVDHPESLYLITFLSGYARGLTRRLLVNNHIAARMGIELGDNFTPEEAEMLEALKKYYQVNALVGQHWDDLAKRYPLSEEISVAMAYKSAEGWDALGALQQHVKAGNGSRFVEIWQQVTDKLNSTMHDTANGSAIKVWQGVDIGHGFESFKTHALYNAFLISGLRKREFGAQEKTGLKAVVLEDDADQQAAWREMVENHSSLIAPDESSYTTPEGIEDRYLDPTISMFLLDIQNGDDAIAGIRIAEQVLFRRLEYSWYYQGTDKQLPNTKIIVWSTSPDAVKAANSHFRELIEYLPDRLKDHLGYSVGGSGRSLGNEDPVYLEVRNKRWHEYSDIG